MGSIVITRQWLDSVAKALDAVTSSGQALAAVQAAESFGLEVADAVDEGNSWFSHDPWRDEAIRNLNDAVKPVHALRDFYGMDSEAPVGSDWPLSHRGKVFYLYILAQTIRQGYPADTDTASLDVTLTTGAAALLTDILAAPKAVIRYAGDLAGEAVDTVGAVGRKAIKAAGGIVGEAAGQAKKAAEDIIPWGVVIGALAVTGALVGLVILASRTGALREVMKVVPR